MIPSVLARQLQAGTADYFRTTFPFSNEPFKSSFERFVADGRGLYLEPYTAIRLPFRTASEMPTFFKAIHPKFLPYVHQKRAWRRLVGDDGQSTVIATGTGSGKTECFLYPILEYCYQHRETRGVKALVIYPMNALASDQAGRIARLISGNPELKGNVSVGLYVGGLDKGHGSMVMGEDSVIIDRETMQNNPPDILLTNYKMLDYLLVRPDYTRIWASKGFSPLKYVAVDEMHTFDGAQGTDLACLLRRLKTRLRIPQGSLCCVGTSATMGDASSTEGIRKYAGDIFGEPFDESSVIVEDRLSVEEFLADIIPGDDPVMDDAQCKYLSDLSMSNDLRGYLQSALDSLCDSLTGADCSSFSTRRSLCDELRGNTLFRDLLELSKGHFFQSSAIASELARRHPWLVELEHPEVVLDALVALVSHARTGSEGSPRPFLTVQTQLWQRELARLVSEVSGGETRFELAINLKEGERKRFLPLHNCRDCGQTAWISLIDRDLDLKPGNLDAFYNSYFGDGENIVSLYPRGIQDPRPENLRTAWLCPGCLHVHVDNEQASRKERHTCTVCDTECIPVFLSEPSTSSRGGSKTSESRQYVCPHCGSTQGLSLMGLRSTTEAEVALSQMFASGFDDDSKALAFSDNVQDASHRAGFFNGRTWRFGLRTAMSKWLDEGGSGLDLAEFAEKFPSHFRGAMSREEFVSRFLAPNNLWMRDYEKMVETGSLPHGEGADKLLENVTNRMRYEVVLEFGMRRNLGRTLEKSGVATVAYDRAALASAVDTACELAMNEEGFRARPDEMGHLIVLLLDHLRSRGAIADPVYDRYVSSGANAFLALSHKRTNYLPGLHASTTPQFLLRRGNAKGFEGMSSSAISRLAAKCFPDRMNAVDIVRCAIRACEEAGLVVRLAPESRYECYALAEKTMTITGDLVRLSCPVCGAQRRVAEENLEALIGAPCLNGGCPGHFVVSNSQGHDYYGDLFSRGLSKRIRAAEHTGLLQRTEREELESEFKASEEESRPWYPNVLSCTPTLEMGIDIGDLSSLILCGMPPGQAQFLQRVGRAGRRDGNAFCLVLADANPSGMYFYASPGEMLEGVVEPPRVFLHAAAVLERQLVAFCMDCWILARGDSATVPKNVRACLAVVAPGKIDASKFPFNFLNYVKANKRMLLNTFLNMFRDDLGDDEQTRESLRSFIMGSGTTDDFSDVPFYLHVLRVFEDRWKLRESYRGQRETLKNAIAELEGKPSDSSFEEQIKERRYELRAVIDVIKGIENEDVYGLLSREGLLPNYAFPEDGVNLRTVVRRRSEEDEGDGTRWERTTREYSRAAASAITDFAPRNTFYAGGRHFTVDQIDLSTSEEELWRLCPNCSHAERIVPDTASSTCPKCGSPAWADAGQVHKMIRLKTVVSNVDDIDSRTDDTSDRRTREFFSSQLLVDIDRSDVLGAYHVENKATGLDFGFEYAREAMLREVNFGKSRDVVGRQTFVAGHEGIRPGFRYCTKCGMVEQETRGKKEIKHTFSCPVTTGSAREEDVVEDSLFIYREFKSEALRLLIPETSFVSDDESIQETFIAAVMLGLRKRFGNVDHLSATISDEPISDGSGYRKRFLVLYDSVPGGTGYLKQLATGKDALMDVLSLSRDALTTCSCNEDPDKDGCYHCLFAFRTTKNVGSISRNKAVRILDEILNPDNEISAVPTVSDILPNNLLESELERKFVDALATAKGPNGGKAKVVKELVNDKMGYEFSVDGIIWDVEPQVTLGPADGVPIMCKPDFVLWPQVRHGEKPPWHPVAVFTDGFEFHKDRVADDSAKREAIRRSGRFRVWGLSYSDVETALDKSSGDYYLDCLKIPELPREDVYNKYLSTRTTSGFAPSKLTPFEMFCWYLTHSEAEQAFSDHANAYSMGMLGLVRDQVVFDRYNDVIEDVCNSLLHETSPLSFGSSLLNRWNPSENEHLSVYAGTTAQSAGAGKVDIVASLLDDRTPDAKGFKRNWNGYLDLFNIMQFSEAFHAVTMLGLENGDYSKLGSAQDAPSVNEAQSGHETPIVSAAQSGHDAWQEVIDELFDDESREFADRLSNLGVDLPDEPGYELDDAMAELAWPSRKICYLTEEQVDDRSFFEGNGWTIIRPSMDDATILDAFS